MACTAASGTGSLTFIDDRSPDRSSRMNCDMYRFSAQIQLNAGKPIGQRFKVQMHDDPSMRQKQLQSFWKQRSRMFLNCSSSPSERVAFK